MMLRHNFGIYNFDLLCFAIEKTLQTAQVDGSEDGDSYGNAQNVRRGHSAR